MMPARPASRARLAAALLAAALAPRVAAAQSTAVENTKTAQALYEQALVALDRKDFATACPQLEEVVRLEPAGIGAKITLGECYQGAGRLASAWSVYALAEAAAGAAHQVERQNKAHDRAAALKPRLAHLTVIVPAPVAALPGLEVRRDGVVVGAAQWGVALPSDGGEHRLTAVATGKARWDQAVLVVDGTGGSITVGPLADAPAVVQPALTPSLVPAAPPSPPPLMPAGIAVGVVGLAGIAVGSAFGAMAIARKNDTQTACIQQQECNGAAYQSRSTGYTYGNVSTALIVVGGAALATAVTLVVFARTGPQATAQLRIGPTGATLGGTF